MPTLTSGNQVLTFGPGVTNGTTIESLFQRAKSRSKGSRPSGTARGTPGWYHRLVEYARRARQPLEESWRIAEEEYNAGRKITRGVYSISGTDPVRPARVYSMVHTIESMVTVSRPKVFIEGHTAVVDEGRADAMQAALNNEWRRNFALTREQKLCARDCTKYGVGVMLTLLETDREAPDSESTGGDFDLSDAVIKAEGGATRASRPRPSSPETYEADSRVRRDKLVSRRISPWNFFVDPEAVSLDDARFMFDDIYVDVESVRLDESLDNRDKIEPTHTAGQILSNRGDNEDRQYQQFNPYDMVLIHRIWERIPGGKWRMVLLPEGQDFFLKTEEHPYWIGAPYCVLRWNQDGQHFYPPSDVCTAMREIVAERNLYTKVFDGYSREHLDVTFFDNSIGVSEEEIHGAKTSDVGRFVSVTGSQGRPLQNAFFRLPKDSKSPEAINLLGMIERGIQISSGLGPNQLGQALKSETSATEAAEIGQFARARGGHKLAGMEEFVSQVSYQRLGLMAQFYEADDIVALIGTDLAESWFSRPFNEADVQSGFDVVVDPGVMRPQSDEVRVNQLLNFLGVVSQNPVAMSLVNMQEMIQELARRMGFHEGSKLLFPANQDQLAESQGNLAVLQALRGSGPRGSAPAPRSGSPQQAAQGGAT